MARALWMATPEPEDHISPEEMRQVDAHLAYPGRNPLMPRSGISPSGGVAATISGLTVSVRDLTGILSPTDAPWMDNTGAYRFVLHAVDLPVDPADGALTRTDLLVARIQDHDVDGSGVRQAIAAILTGTPGGGQPEPGPAELPLSVITAIPGESLTIAPAGLYTVALGGIPPVQTASALPTEGLYAGVAAYAQAEQALYIAHGGQWQVVGSRRGYQWGGARRFVSSGTFAKGDFPGIRAVRVKVQGGGGAGGGSRATTVDTVAGTRESSSSGGGGGGCYAEAVILASSLAASVTVTVGAGGTSPAGAPGNAGGTSSFGSFVSSPGGGGGFDRQPSTGHAASTGAVMSEDASITGHIVGTELVVRGGAGGGGYSFGGSVISAGTLDKGAYGHGGNSFLAGTGRGARGPSTSATAGQPYGGGGSGNVCGHTDTSGEAAKAGGNGAPGIVIVELLY